MARNKDQILEFVGRFPGRDDDEISKALKITPRQVVNSVCRQLVKEGAIERRAGASGKLANFRRISKDAARQSQPVASAKAAPSPPADSTTEWFWEGNVTESVAAYLEDRGWVIGFRADTRSRERGVDIHASRETIELLVEVKGYPSASYRDPARANERKPTNPSLQAHHWFAQAVLKGMRLQGSNPDARVVMAFPDFPRYRALFQETKKALSKLGMSTLFVSQDGSIELEGTSLD